jgi:parallel beta-helix repeat protein
LFSISFIQLSSEQIEKESGHAYVLVNINIPVNKISLLQQSKKGFVIDSGLKLKIRRIQMCWHLNKVFSTWAMLITIFLIISLPNNLFSQEDDSETYYVAIDGDDGYSGGYEDPFRTVTRALSEKKEDTRLYIKIFPSSEAYNEAVQITQGGEGNTDAIIISNVPGMDKPVFSGSSNIFTTDKGAVFEWSSANYVTLSGIIIENVIKHDKLMGIWIRGDHNTIIDCELRELNRSGIVVQGSYNIIKNNTIWDINGVNGKKGNNISIEGYPNGTSSDNNQVIGNHLYDNPTHVGVNIFPATDDCDQTIMSNNIVYNNYIHDCSHGIYTRFQRNLEIINNIIVNCRITPQEPTGGKAITLDWYENDPPCQPHNHQKPLDVGIIKIYNNTVADNDLHGINNEGYNTLEIFNNILINNGNTGQSGHGHVRFNYTGSEAYIDNNLYFGTGSWEWDNVFKLNFAAWQGNNERDVNGVNGINPDFITVNDISYAIDYDSPAKNKGKGLFNLGVEKDKFGNPRPYWNYDFDIGAFEIEDTQLKVGVEGGASNTERTFRLTAFGTYWEKQGDNWNISSDQSLLSVDYIQTGFNEDPDTNTWLGFEYKWLLRSGSQFQTNKTGAAFYKFSVWEPVNGELTEVKHFFLDLRDAVTQYSPNIYIKYYITQTQQKLQYLNVNKSWEDINDGDILRIWDIRNGNYNVNSLYPYWENALVVVPGPNNHPLMVWGPYPVDEQFPEVDYYYISRKDGGLPWQYDIRTTPNTEYDYEDTDFSFSGYGGHTVQYKVRAGRDDIYYSGFSNTGSIIVSGNDPGKKNVQEVHNYDFSLNQNYPNPFNPATVISFTLAEKQYVKLKLYDITGREVKILADSEYDAGIHNVEFNGSELSSGVYFYRIIAGNYLETKKLQILK